MSENKPVYRNDRSEAIDAIAARRAQDVAREIGDELSRQLAEDDRPTVLERSPAATSRLNEAAAALAVSERELVQAQERLRAATDADREQADRDLKEKLSEYSEALYDGRPGDAAEVMTVIMAGRRRTTAPIDVQAMKAAVKRELAKDSTLEAFAGAFPEIVADPHLAAIADRYFDAALKEGKSQGEAFAAAGDKTRGYIRGLGEQLGMRDQGSRGDRTGNDAPETDEPVDTSSIIAEMAAARAHAAGRRHQEDDQ